MGSWSWLPAFWVCTQKKRPLQWTGAWTRPQTAKYLSPSRAQVSDSSCLCSNCPSSLQVYLKFPLCTASCSDSGAKGTRGLVALLHWVYSDLMHKDRYSTQTLPSLPASTNRNLVPVKVDKNLHHHCYIANAAQVLNRIQWGWVMKCWIAYLIAPSSILTSLVTKCLLPPTLLFPWNATHL